MHLRPTIDHPSQSAASDRAISPSGPPARPSTIHDTTSHFRPAGSRGRGGMGRGVGRGVDGQRGAAPPWPIYARRALPLTAVERRPLSVNERQLSPRRRPAVSAGRPARAIHSQGQGWRGATGTVNNTRHADRRQWSRPARVMSGSVFRRRRRGAADGCQRRQPDRHLTVGPYKTEHDRWRRTHWPTSDRDKVGDRLWQQTDR